MEYLAEVGPVIAIVLLLGMGMVGYYLLISR